ncbi:hypothetical protein HYT23_05680 [Candidatus Pacearchaeota archaeon]|nr:hypothetical protein [Candidatus Pacearchaeota archaeon]
MRFDNFLKQGLARIAKKDENLAKALFMTAKRDLIFLERTEIDEFSSRKIMVGFYDVLRNLLEAIAALNGFKIYSHEAFTFYLKEIGEETISVKFDRLRKIRNRINYYGQLVSVEETEENINEMKEIIVFLINKYLKFLEG